MQLVITVPGDHIISWLQFVCKIICFIISDTPDKILIYICSIGDSDVLRQRGHINLKSVVYFIDDYGAPYHASHVLESEMSIIHQIYI